ncbi:respiratory nitrate reductase subunit gamma [Streptomyces sp. NPDC046909]|uniref:respiratory nitrate reductase subunit gamma n=1 Tax=Streptomyces sp. NPDC046909 TaxID=3155617 RepID=UPI0033E95FAD
MPPSYRRGGTTPQRPNVPGAGLSGPRDPDRPPSGLLRRGDARDRRPAQLRYRCGRGPRSPLTRRIRRGTDRGDRLHRPLLSATVLLGITATAAHHVFGAGHDYRGAVSVWFRGLFALRPQRVTVSG